MEGTDKSTQTMKFESKEVKISKIQLDEKVVKKDKHLIIHVLRGKICGWLTTQPY